MHRPFTPWRVEERWSGYWNLTITMQKGEISRGRKLSCREKGLGRQIERFEDFVVACLGGLLIVVSLPWFVYMSTEFWDSSGLFASILSKKIKFFMKQFERMKMIDLRIFFLFLFEKNLNKEKSAWDFESKIELNTSKKGNVFGFFWGKRDFLKYSWTCGIETPSGIRFDGKKKNSGIFQREDCNSKRLDVGHWLPIFFLAWNGPWQVDAGYPANRSRQSGQSSPILSPSSALHIANSGPANLITIRSHFPA